jgi:MoaA/NifB/PqqE/SkfB family radical SAM enzyme
MGFVLNPLVRLKKNRNRILIYKIDDFYQEPEQINPIHPTFAILLSMFDGRKSYDRVLHDFFYVTNNEDSPEKRRFIEEQLHFIEKDLLKIDKLLVKKSEIEKKGLRPIKYLPEHFIIPQENIDIRPYDKRIDFPLTINYNVTTSCSFNCRYCYHPRFEMPELISLERLKAIFDELMENGCEYITLSGGDPFDRPDLIEIINEINKRSLDYFLSTKSYLDKKTCRQLKKAGLKKMQISLDAADSKLAAFLVRKEGFLEDSIETIQNLKDLKITVRLKCVVTNYNIDQLQAYLDLSKSLEVDKVHLVQYGRSIWHHHDTLFPTDEQMKAANEVVEEFRIRNQLPQITGGMFERNVITNQGLLEDSKDLFQDRSICNAGRFALTLLPNGEISICEQLMYSPEIVLGDLRTQSVKEAWDGPLIHKWLQAPPREIFKSDSPCYTCQDDNYRQCHESISRCLRDSYHYFGNLSSPDIRCKLAQINDFRIV